MFLKNALHEADCIKMFPAALQVDCGEKPPSRSGNEIHQDFPVAIASATVAPNGGQDKRTQIAISSLVAYNFSSRAKGSGVVFPVSVFLRAIVLNPFPGKACGTVPPRLEDFQQGYVMKEEYSFFCPIRVRYSEIDKQGIVYNGTYFTYIDVAFGEFLRASGHPYRAIVEATGVEVCHVKTTIDFCASAFGDDLLEVGMRTLAIGNKSFTMGTEIYRQGEDKLLVKAESIYAGYSPELRKALEIPPLLRQILSR